MHPARSLCAYRFSFAQPQQKHFFHWTPWRSREQTKTHEYCTQLSAFSARKILKALGHKGVKRQKSNEQKSSQTPKNTLRSSFWTSVTYKCTNWMPVNARWEKERGTSTVWSVKSVIHYCRCPINKRQPVRTFAPHSSYTIH